MGELSQFIRAETHPLQRSSLSGKSKNRRGRRQGWNARDIRNEAERRPGAIPHITCPTLPTVKYGVTPSEVVARIETEISKRKKTLQQAAAQGGKVRRIRRDQHVMVSGVASYPVDWEVVRADPDEAAKLAAWQKDVVEFLVDHYAKVGGELVSVIAHTDEKYPHLHFYVLPTASPTFAAREVHDGWRQKLSARATGLGKKDVDAAYVKGTKVLRDAFYASVSSKYGHKRDKEKRPRVARSIFVSERRHLAQEQKSLAESHRAVDEKRDQLIQKNAELDNRLRGLEQAENELTVRQNALGNHEVEIGRREAATQKKETELGLALAQCRARDHELAGLLKKAEAEKAMFLAAIKEVLPQAQTVLDELRASIVALARTRDRYRHPKNPAEAQAYSAARSTVELLERAAFAIDTFVMAKSTPTHDPSDIPDFEAESHSGSANPSW